MKTSHHSPWLWRPAGVTVAASLTLPMFLAGCGSPAPPPQAPMQSNRPAANAGMNTRQKLTLLAGAAALYYMYNRYKKQNEAKLQGQNVQYYLSKNGRVYYRDPRNPRNVVWVTPPPQQAQTFQVPADEASQYQQFQGYDNASSGRELRDVFQVR